MADWDGPFMVARFLAEAGIATANELSVVNDIYPRLSTAQRTVLRMSASRYTNPFYRAPTTLTRAADGKTYTFGADPADPTRNMVPMGWVQIAPYQNAFSGDYFTGWIEGRDFISEGDRIRMPSNRAFGGTLYGRWVDTPANISASVGPSILPIDVAELTVIKAVEDWAQEGDQAPDVTARMTAKFKAKWPEYMLMWRRQYRGGGALLDPARWYFSVPDLGTGSRS